VTVVEPRHPSSAPNLDDGLTATFGVQSVRFPTGLHAPSPKGLRLDLENMELCVAALGS
jgi:hypothetical protein